MTSDLDLLSMTTEHEFQEVIPEETEVIIPVFIRKRVIRKMRNVLIHKPRQII